MTFSYPRLKKSTFDKANESLLTRFPDEVLARIFKHLTKKDVARMKYVHRNFHNVAKAILLRSIVVFTEDKKAYSFPVQWADYTYSSSEKFFRMFRSRYFDPEYNKTLIFMGPLGEKADYVERLKHAFNDVQLYNTIKVGQLNVVSVTVWDKKGQPEACWSVMAPDQSDRVHYGHYAHYGDYGFYLQVFNVPSGLLQEMKISKQKVQFRGGMINCRSLVLDSCDAPGLLTRVNYEKIEAMSFCNQPKSFMESLTEMARHFTNLKELGIVDDQDIDFQSFALALSSHSLTKLEMICKVDGLGLEFDNILCHHSRSLETIVYHYKDKTPKTFSYYQSEVQHDMRAMPLGFRLLKLEDFPRLKELVYDGGKYSVNRSGHKPRLVYSAY